MLSISADNTLVKIYIIDNLYTLGSMIENLESNVLIIFILPNIYSGNLTGEIISKQ